MNRNWPEFVYPAADLFLRLRSVLGGSGYPLHRNEPIRPFFIVGAPRSGNTLLRRILAASPEVHIPPETYVLGRAIRTFRRVRHHDWPHIVGPVLALFEFHPEFVHFKIALRPLFDRLVDVTKDRRSLAFVLDSVYRYHGESVGKTCTCWGDKTPLNVYCLPQIRSVFPEARFIHMVRDGVDSVFSMLVKTKFEWGVPEAARRWMSSIRAARRFARRNPSTCFELRYEDLVTNPGKSVGRLCEWLETPFDQSFVDSQAHSDEMKDVSSYEHHVNVFKPIMTDSIGKGRRELNATQKRQLQRLIGSGLAKLGYEPAA